MYNNMYNIIILSMQYQHTDIYKQIQTHIIAQQQKNNSMIFRQSIDICKFVSESKQSGHSSQYTQDIIHSCQARNQSHRNMRDQGQAVILKTNTKNKQSTIGYNKWNVNFYQPEPWTQNYYQVADYSKKQELNRNNNKCFTSRTMTNNFNTKHTPKSHNRTLSSKQNSQSKLNKIQRVFSEEHEQMQKLQSRKFNAVTISNQERVKWELQLKIVMRRKKKLSNMLKMRHFGNYQHHTIEKSNKQSSRMHTEGAVADSASLQKLLKQSQTNNDIIHEIITQRELGQTLRESIDPKLKSIYTLLKTASRNQGLTKKLSQSCGSQVVSHHSSFIKIKSTSMGSTRYISNSPAIKGNNCLKNSIQQKGIIKLVLPTDKNSQKLRSNSLNLTTNSYTGHSLNIKNKLKLMKTNKNHQHSRVSSRGSFIKQKVQEVSNLVKQTMFI